MIIYFSYKIMALNISFLKIMPIYPVSLSRLRVILTRADKLLILPQILESYIFRHLEKKD